MEDKTIDKNKKYPPMENLTDAGKKSSARSGLQKLKRIRDEMFKKRHQSLKEEDENKQNQENSPAGILFLFCITHPTTLNLKIRLALHSNIFVQKFREIDKL